MKMPNKIESIEDALEISKNFPGGWFRGHDQAYNNLTPKAFRKNYTLGSDAEFYFIQKFKIYAPVFQGSAPDSTDHLSWLILAQHFGLPTRLLDWTESILVALWFSVNNYSTNSIKDETSYADNDAELWALHPGSLNKFHDNELLHDDIALGENLLVRYLAEQPMVRKEIQYQETVKKDYRENYGENFKFPEYPIAFMPQRTIQRQASQLSVFTIHPKQEKGKSIIEILKNEKDLFRSVIPANSKNKLKEELLYLGITRRMLFQDLESLSYDIINEAMSSD